MGKEIAQRLIEGGFPVHVAAHAESMDPVWIYSWMPQEPNCEDTNL
jgi:hypothetical protein